MSWQTLDNSISVPLESLNFKGYNPIAQYLKDKIYNFYDLYPFKIVNLEWCTTNGHAKEILHMIPSGTPAYHIFKLMFVGTNYYPFGDAFVFDSDINDLSKIPVVLISKNVATKIFTLLSATDLQGDQFQNSDYYFYLPKYPLTNIYFSVIISNNFYNEQNQYASLDISYFFKSLGSPSSIRMEGINGNLEIALTFANMTNSIDFIPDCLRAAYYMNTILANYPDFNNQNALYNEFITVAQGFEQSQLSEFMNNFCQGRNVLLDQCYQFCSADANNCDKNLTNYCSNTEIQFTINDGNSYFIDIPFMDVSQITCQLVEFPNTIYQLNVDYVINNGFLVFNKLPTNPPIGSTIQITVDYTKTPLNQEKLNGSYNFEQTCPCFSKPLFDAWYKNTFGPLLNNPQSKNWIDSFDMSPGCNLPECVKSTDALKRKGTCPPENIQICVNDQKIYNKGTFDDSTINLDSFICCTQESNNTTIPGQSKCSKTTFLNPVFVYTFLGFVGLFLLVILIRMFMKKRT
jgi:hypothetical protein